ncbi:MAG: cation transporter, partial [Bdellovibrionaceae bacterium]|nr:cation transporter [Pseudobdellovibrionaceae bacterium]
MKHSHSHSHSHSARDGLATSRIGIALALNLFFALLELIGGFLTNSVAILSDALHDFGDSLALALALVLESYSRRAHN